MFTPIMNQVMSYGIYIAIIIGLIFPISPEFRFLMPFFLGIILFFSFLKLECKWDCFFSKELFYYAFFGLMIVPFIVFQITKGLEPALRLGMFLVTITPTAIGAPIIVDFIHGNKEITISNVVLYNFLAPLTYPLLLHIFFKNTSLTVSTKIIFVKLMFMIFIPFLIALLIRRFIKVKRNLLNISNYVSPLAFILVVGIAVSLASSNLRQLDMGNLISISFFVSMFAFGSFYLGFSLSKKSKIKRTLAVIFGHKNSALATWVSLSNFAPPVVVPMIFYIIFHHIINGILIHRYSNVELPLRSV